MSTEKEESNLVANVLVHRVVTSFRSTAYITKFLILKVLVTEHVEPPKRFKLFCELQLHSPHTHTSQLQQHIKLSAENEEPNCFANMLDVHPEPNSRRHHKVPTTESVDDRTLARH